MSQTSVSHSSKFDKYGFALNFTFTDKSYEPMFTSVTLAKLAGGGRGIALILAGFFFSETNFVLHRIIFCHIM